VAMAGCAARRLRALVLTHLGGIIGGVVLLALTLVLPLSALGRGVEARAACWSPGPLRSRLPRPQIKLNWLGKVRDPFAQGSPPSTPRTRSRHGLLATASGYRRPFDNRRVGILLVGVVKSVLK
jgi:hypothetical protein